MKLQTALRLGRVSNLPTVWTNALAGAALAGAVPTPRVYCVLTLGLSLFYVGGMYLNDAFDREHDARVRPERPIPSGEVSASSVFALGFGMLFAGLVLVPVAASLSAGVPVRACASAFGLGAMIVFYDLYHKQNALSPVVMGLCRVLVYLTAGLSVVATPADALYLGAAALLSYLIGLSYAAKQENLGHVEHAWPLLCLVLPLLAARTLHDPISFALLVTFAVATAIATRWLLRRKGRDIPRAVSQLIAGICLLDGLLVASIGHTVLGVACVMGTVLTLVLQRFIAGT